MKNLFIYIGMTVSLLTAAGTMKVNAADVKVQDTTGTVSFTTGGGGAGALNLNAASLPTDLKFGSAAINYNAEIVLKATADGKQSSAATTGTVEVTDVRGTAAGWKVKVEQAKQFEEGTSKKELTGAVLSMRAGNVTNVGGVAPTGGLTSQKINFTPGTAVEMFVANANEGDGISSLPIDEFDLSIPGIAPKAAGAYTTAVTWTISDTI